MKLVVTDSSYRNKGFVKRFALDMAFGSDENDFTLTVPCGTEIEVGSLVYVPGTEWGGLVREPWTVSEDGEAYRVYHGPTWHGLMEDRILYPDPGVDYLTVSGDANDAIRSLVNRVGLQSVFEAAPPCGIQVSSWQFDHDSTYLYGGLMKMLESVGCILDIRRGTTGKTVLGAIPTPRHIDRSSKTGFRLKRFHPKNHLKCLGKGELKDRICVDLYASKAGNVSQTQSIFGIDVSEEIYDLASAEREELIEQGTKHLKELQVFSEAKLKLPEGRDYRVGSIVGKSDPRARVSVTAKVGKMIVKLYSSGTYDIQATLDDESIEWKED